MKNQLIDALDSLVFPAETNDRWAAAEQLADQMGIKSILVGEVNGSLQDISWLSTNMPATWMEEYMGEDYMSVDPVIHELATQPGRITIQCGSTHTDETVNGKAWSLNHGLKDVGYETLHCSRFGPAGGLGKYVTLAFHEHGNGSQASSPSNKDLFAALLACTISSTEAPDAQQFGPIGPTSLTTRQREVLSLLAEGMMTARIAEELGITEASVSFHFANARKVLGANTREHALALALKQGQISL